MDIRTYIALEQSLIHRLVTSWKKASEDVYQDIAEAITNKDWQKAVALVPQLDMTHVGEKNKEYIKYMLRSCAIFGAKIANKKGPQFVSAGDFDHRMTHVANMMCQYFEHRATSMVQAKALQSIAEAESNAKQQLLESVSKFNPYHDEMGRFTSADGASSMSEYKGRMSSDTTAVLTRLRLNIQSKDVDPMTIKVGFLLWVEKAEKIASWSREGIAKNPIAFAELKDQLGVGEFSKEDIENMKSDPMAYYEFFQKEIEEVVGYRTEAGFWSTGRMDGVYGGVRVSDFDLKTDTGQRKFVSDVANELGIPKLGTSDGVSVLTHFTKDTFMLNGVELNYGGYFNAGTKQLGVYPRQLSAEGIVSVMSHEFSHLKYNAVKDQMKVNDVSYEKWPDGIAMLNRLIASDGVTEYSKDWWKAHAASTATAEQAMNETLAEISTLSHAERDAKVAPEWKSLYKEMETLYNTRRKNLS